MSALIVFDRRLQGREAETKTAQNRHWHVDWTVLRRSVDGTAEGEGSKLRCAVSEGLLPSRFSVRGGAESPWRHTARPER